MTVADSPEQAHEALREIFVEHRFAAERASAIVEERLQGIELSLLALCDGRSAVPLAPARDFKRIGDGDEGPNTGGMGAYSPVAGLSDADALNLSHFLQQPIVDWMRERGTPYHGVLYAGLMLTPDGPRVLEYNVRFGDPETQAVLPRMQSNLLDLLLRCAAAGRPGHRGRHPAARPVVSRMGRDGGAGERRLSRVLSQRRSDRGPRWCVRRRGGHPRRHRPGPGGNVVTAGGRVLNVTGFGPDAKSAREAAYAAAGMISFEGMQLRTDIAAAADRSPALPAGARSLSSWFDEWAESGDELQLENLDG